MPRLRKRTGRKPNAASRPIRKGAQRVEIFDSGLHAGRVTQARPRLSVVGVEDAPLREIVAAHREHLGRIGGRPDPMPGDLRGLVALYDDYLAAAID